MRNARLIGLSANAREFIRANCLEELSAAGHIEIAGTDLRLKKWSGVGGAYYEYVQEILWDFDALVFTSIGQHGNGVNEADWAKSEIKTGVAY